MKHYPKVLLMFFSISLGSFVALWSWNGYGAGPPPPRFNQGLAIVQTPEGFTIFAEMAVTPEQRSRGLMYRKRLAPHRGMLFKFDEPDYWTFWMKNTKIPLDIIWLDEHDVIVHIQHAAPICERRDNLCPRYRSTTPAMSVLELGAGQAKKLNLKPGTKLTISLP